MHDLFGWFVAAFWDKIPMFHAANWCNYVWQNSICSVKLKADSPQCLRATGGEKGRAGALPAAPAYIFKLYRLGP